MPQRSNGHAITGFMGGEIKVALTPDRAIPTTNAVLGIRPEQLSIAAADSAPNGVNRLPGRILMARFVGNVIKVEVEIGPAQTIIIDSHPSMMPHLDGGAEVAVTWKPEAGFLLED